MSFSPDLKINFRGVINNIISDVGIANNMEKQMKISDKEEGRLKPVHGTSLRERESINSCKKATKGDY